MTAADRVYAETLNLLGSDTRWPESIETPVHKMHDRAEASHKTEEK